MNKKYISKIFTVYELNKKIHKILKKKIGYILLSGEISNFSQPFSGHWYLTIKDKYSQIRCIMFRNKNKLIKFYPKNGEQITIQAYISIYEPKGDYQLIITKMKKIGIGKLQENFELLKKSLQKEGLFDKKHKKKISKPIKKLGIITSIYGAALYDILNILKRRDPLLFIIIYQTNVQGKKSIPQIIQAIELANKRNECNVLILARGGGSQEDLNIFNNEKIIRKIFFSKIPIISAIGHETDITITDFISDLRAPTPSAAAELVSRNLFELLDKINTQKQRIEIAMDLFLEKIYKNYNNKNNNLLHNNQQIILMKQKNILITLTKKIQKIILTIIHKNQKKFYNTKKNFSSSLFFNKNININFQKIQKIYYSIYKFFFHTINFKKVLFLKYCFNLEKMNPLKILSRGFSITSKKNGNIIKNIKQIKINEIINTKIKNGSFISKIIQIIF